MLALNSIVVLALQDLTLMMTSLWSMPFQNKNNNNKNKTNKKKAKTLKCFVFLLFFKGLDHKQVIVTINGITLLSTGERCVCYHVVSSANYLHAQLLL